MNNIQFDKTVAKVVFYSCICSISVNELLYFLECLRYSLTAQLYQ